MKQFIPIFNILSGLGIYASWVRWMILRKSKQNIFKWKGGHTILWPHVLIELLTAALLIISGLGMIFDLIWAKLLTVFALGSLFYSSLNTLSQIDADKERLIYPATILIGFLGSLVCILFILISLKH